MGLIVAVVVFTVWLVLIGPFFGMVDSIDTQFIQPMSDLSALEAAIPALIKLSYFILPIVAIMLIVLRGRSQ